MISADSLNLFLALAMLLFIINGFFQGLIHMIGSMIGLVIGVAVASRLDVSVGAWIAHATGWNPMICVAIGFILLLIVFTRLFGFAVAILEKMLKLLKIPFTGLLNRVGGSFLGLIEGTFVIGLTLLLLKSMPFGFFSKSIAASSLAMSLIAASKIMLPILPKALRQIYEGK